MKCCQVLHNPYSLFLIVIVWFVQFILLIIRPPCVRPFVHPLVSNLLVSYVICCLYSLLTKKKKKKVWVEWGVGVGVRLEY